MDPITQQQALAAAGAAGGEGLYVDDVFSTFLYEGNEGSQTINNGIDLSGEGGLVWVKRRNLTERHSLFDTENGITKHLATNENSAARVRSFVSSFNTDGFSFNSGDTEVNNLNDDYVSWTFRKCPGFFDVVTYTGNGTFYHNISHNLGSVPGSIWIKRVDQASNWEVYHRGLDSTAPQDYKIYLNETGARINYDSFADTAPTATEFTLGSFADVNANGGTYVAYLFAHDDQSFGKNGDEAIIKCGSYTGSSNEQTISVGFEPQWLLIKSLDSTGNWQLLDTMRGFNRANAFSLSPNNNDAEADIGLFGALGIKLSPTSTGFTLSSNYAFLNQSGDNYIYIAIRRPHKPPEAGTEVFAVDNNDTGHSANRPSFISNFPVDLYIRRNQIDNSDSPEFGTRLINRLQNITDTSSSNDLGTSVFPYNNGVLELGNVRATDYVWMFKRAPGFLDIVAYDGNSTSGRAVSHNLGVVPELMVFKSRDGNRAWRVYDANTGAGGSLRLNADAAKDSNSAYWSTPTADNIILGNDQDTNSSSYDYVAYLFATLAGISKVGSFTGTGSDLNIDCGFTAGARFLLIKRTDSSGDWYLYDSLRGIVSGNDPYYLLNSNTAQVSNTDYIDPLNAGFTVTSSAPAGLNASGGTYIFLAIA